MAKEQATKKFGRGLVIDDDAVTAGLPRTSSLFGGGALKAPPSAMELTNSLPPIRNQGESSACVGFAFQFAIDTRLSYLQKLQEPHSPLGLYSYGRMAALHDMGPKTKLVDEGSQPSLVVAAAMRWGLTTEASWPFKIEEINSVPPVDVLQNASAFVPSGLYRVGGQGVTRLRAVKHALANHYPVPFGTVVDSAFEDYTAKHPAKSKKQGIAYVSQASRTGPQDLHMLCIVGYEEADDAPDGVRFLIANSWGTDWGWRGFAWAGPDFITDDRARWFYTVTLESREAVGV